jgi:TRAP-type C4-dicarboxylate transport system, large permease component
MIGISADGGFVRSRQALSSEDAAGARHARKGPSVLDGMAGVFTMVIILGGIISGVFTATEAGAAASMYGTFLTVFVYGKSRFPSCRKSSGNAALPTRSSCC